MINRTESEEKIYLESVKHRLGNALDALVGRVRRYEQEIREQKTYLWEHKADMDHVEKISARESVHQAVFSGEAVAETRNRIKKLIQSPYFGRFDFVSGEGEEQPLPIYVGVHAFADEKERKNLIFDWRAPISSMFYDYEIGKARYDSPLGPVSGEILLKRQYRIHNGEMKFMLESGLNIMDDVLQEELSRTSDDRMKTIVATIQRDQNAIIRNEDATILIIQGVAGSGKTSIALHRIAFLLYRFREHLTSRDILIISPNKIFADFISNVLPELGEEQIPEIGMEDMARELLHGKYQFQTFIEQSSLLLENKDQALGRRIEEKSSLGFVKKLEEYSAYVEKSRLKPCDIRVKGHLVSAELIERSFRQRSGRPIGERLRWVAETIEHYLWVEYRCTISARERTTLKASVKKMFRNPSIRSLYKDFFHWLGKPELFKASRRASLEYADVFPIIYLKILLEGVPDRYKTIKHLVVDEMQDYTPIQYAVIAKVFYCNKTILGDVNQSVSPFNASSSEMISRVFRQGEIVKFCKSYRSSYEITQFAQAISPNADLVPIERHGAPPLVLFFTNKKEEKDWIRQAIETFSKRNNYRTMGILCKTQEQAARLYEAIEDGSSEVHLLTPESSSFKQGVVVSSVHLAKGLEFDQVIVPDATTDHYTTSLDRNLLYIACTRAMHRLMLTCVGERTRFIPDPDHERGKHQQKE